MAQKRIVIGAHQLSWGTTLTKETVISWMEAAKKLGCGAFEVFLSGKVSCSPATIRAVAERFGLRVIGLPIMTSDSDPLSVINPKKAIDALKKHIRAVYRMSGTLVVGPLANVLGRTDAVPNEKQYQACVNTFAEVSLFAGRHGIGVAIEPLQWSEMAWPNTCGQVVQLIRDVENVRGAPKGVLGVLFDVYHALRMEEDWPASLKSLLAQDLLFHVHVAGPGRTPPRITQHIDWKQMIGQLKKAKWGGTITIESFGKECDLPLSVVGPGSRLPAQEVIREGVETLRQAGL